MEDLLLIYLFVGLAVTAESIFKVGALLFSGVPEGKKYRANWKEIVAESHMPVVLAVFITVVMMVLQLSLKIILWPITVVDLYIKQNRDLND